MRLRGVRIVTAVAAIGICALTVSRGWDVARFALVRASLGPDDSTAEALQPWIGLPGLTATALKSSLTEPTRRSDIIGALRRHDELADYLAVRPLSPDYWLSLARMRALAELGTESIVAALVMSALTGPNEGYLMSQRGVVGVSQWEALAPESRRRAVTDLMANKLSDREKTSLQRVLSEKSDVVRREVGLALRVEGFPPNDLAKIGL
jgi:hypothetical protein